MRKMIASLLVGVVLVALGILGCSSSPRANEMSSGGGYLNDAVPRTTTGPVQPMRGEAAPPVRADELWVIQKPTAAHAAPDAESQPRTGSLVTRQPGSEEPVGFPLRHTEVRASIAGYIATVDVTQQYHNPYSEKIEAIYVFPLPQDAAVSDFLMTIGDRRIRGVIRERAEAQRIYHAAKAQGHVASLLTQERPNVFTQSVANIEPGKQIDVNIQYFHTLAYADGWYEWVFPMVVGPRFNPPGTTDGIGAIGTGKPGRSGQATEVQYLEPGERSGHDIALSLHIDAGVAIEAIDSRNHKVELRTPEHGLAEVKLAGEDRIPNKDFVLRYKVAGQQLKSAVMAQRDENGQGGWFTLMLFPPQTTSDLPRKPLEMVFTLDVSGSMTGRPMEQSKAAMRYALENMRAGDTFQVVRFASHADQLFDKPMPATGDNIRRAMKYVEQTDAGGGTMMIDGIRKSLNIPHDEQRLRFVCFLTDGFIGNEVEILREIHTVRGPSRIFSFGVGSSTNRYLLDHMAKFGQGAAAYLGMNDRAEEVMQPFFERISHPAMTDITIDWGGLSVHEVYPQKLPDLFVGRPVVLSGRFEGPISDREITIRGKVGNEPREMRVAMKLDEARPHASIRPVWARAKITDLADRSTYEANTDLPGQITQVALAHNLMSNYTAFVAVDASRRTEGSHGTTVAIPVPVPDGVRYETTVDEAK